MSASVAASNAVNAMCNGGGTRAKDLEIKGLQAGAEDAPVNLGQEQGHPAAEGGQ